MAERVPSGRGVAIGLAGRTPLGGIGLGGGERSSSAVSTLSRPTGSVRTAGLPVRTTIAGESVGQQLVKSDFRVPGVQTPQRSPGVYASAREFSTRRKVGLNSPNELPRSQPLIADISHAAPDNGGSNKSASPTQIKGLLESKPFAGSPQRPEDLSHPVDIFWMPARTKPQSSPDARPNAAVRVERPEAVAGNHPIEKLQKESFVEKRYARAIVDKAPIHYGDRTSSRRREAASTQRIVSDSEKRRIAISQEIAGIRSRHEELMSAIAKTVASKTASRVKDESIKPDGMTKQATGVVSEHSSSQLPQGIHNAETWKQKQLSLALKRLQVTHGQTSTDVTEVTDATDSNTSIQSGQRISVRRRLKIWFFNGNDSDPHWDQEVTIKDAQFINALDSHLRGEKRDGRIGKILLKIGEVATARAIWARRSGGIDLTAFLEERRKRNQNILRLPTLVVPDQIPQPETGIAQPGLKTDVPPAANATLHTLPQSLPRRSTDTGAHALPHSQEAAPSMTNSSTSVVSSHETTYGQGAHPENGNGVVEIDIYRSKRILEEDPEYSVDPSAQSARIDEIRQAAENAVVNGSETIDGIDVASRMENPTKSIISGILLWFGGSVDGSYEAVKGFIASLRRLSRKEIEAAAKYAIDEYPAVQLGKGKKVDEKQVQLVVKGPKVTVPQAA